MAKANNKTIPVDLPVQEYLDAIEDSSRKKDCIRIHDLMKEVSGKEPKIWGHSMVGFGSYHYKYDSGREGDMLAVGFSNRKQAITLYIMGGFDRHGELMNKLGPHKTGKSCLYIKRLSDVDIDILSELISESLKAVERKYTIGD